MIKTLIFDVNGTLDEDLKIKLKAMHKALSKFGIHDIALAKKIIVDIERIDSQNPQFEMKKIVYKALKRLKLNLQTIKKIYKLYSNYRIKGEDASIEFLDILPLMARRYKLILYTSANHKSLKKWLEKYEIGRYFSKIYLSSELGIAKPSVEAFEMILKENDLKSSECLMIGDDVIKDLLPAKMAGIKTILISPIVDWHVRNFNDIKKVIY